jgi:uncharacterized integral membrane protein (TIGR00697 family)
MLADSSNVSDTPTAVQARDLRTYKHFDLLLAIFIVVLLISNLVGQKLCLIGPFILSGAQLLFPITYIFGDVFTEVYGYSASRRAIWLGFLANGLLAVMGLITVWLPPAPGWPNQAAFATVFYTIPRLIVASLIAFWCGEFVNSYVLAKMKLWTGGKMLWTRTVGSTVSGQLVDTALIVAIGFGGTAPVSTLVRNAASAYLFKVVYEVVATPLTYMVVGFLKRSEGLDAFDYKSNFNPFHLGTH